MGSFSDTRRDKLSSRYGLEIMASVFALGMRATRSFFFRIRIIALASVIGLYDQGFGYDWEMYDIVINKKKKKKWRDLQSDPFSQWGSTYGIRWLFHTYVTEKITTKLLNEGRGTCVLVYEGAHF